MRYIVTAQSGLNIRTGPGTNYDKTGGYSYGAVVAVEATRNGWGQTDRGWVSMDYLRPVEAADEGLVTDTGLRIIQEAYRPEPTKTYVVAEEKNDLGAWVSVPLGMTEAK